MRSSERRPAVLTLQTLLDESEARLTRAKLTYGHGTTNARDESAWLVLHALGIPFEDLVGKLGTAITPAAATRARGLVARRIRERRPAAYITQEAWLGDFRFYIDERALIPRSYIAELLRARLVPWLRPRERVRRILDLCTGSGCLAIMAASLFSQATVDAADFSRDALEVARRNIRLHRMQNRVRLIRSDLFDQITDTYDIIITNPPYVPAARTDRLPAEYRHEPRLALDGGEDGLDLVRRIVTDAPRFLRPDGLLVVETGHYRQRVERTFASLPLTWPMTSGGDDCVFLLRRPDLVAAAPLPPTPSPPAPPRKAVRRTGRASAARAGRTRRTARASGGSR